MAGFFAVLAVLLSSGFLPGVTSRTVETSSERRFNCLTRESWTDDKREWCCENKKMGCPAEQRTCSAEELEAGTCDRAEDTSPEEDTEERSAGAKKTREPGRFDIVNKSDKQVDVYRDDGKVLGDWLGTIGHGQKVEVKDAPEDKLFYITMKGLRKRIKKFKYKSSKPRRNFLIRPKDLPKHSLKVCEDRDERCPRMGRGNGCESNPGWMITFCPKTCKACDIRDPKIRCDRNFLNVTDSPIYKNGEEGKPGSLHRMFASIEERFKDRYEVNVLSTEPWVVTLDGFFNAEESAEILSTVSHRFERSTDTGSMNEFGESGRIVSKTRTSENAWCREKCENHPTTKKVIKRITEVVGVPYENFESFQILRYQIGQFYRTHHDMSPRQILKTAGPRILTMFLYFSDVEEGGETNFPRLGIDVKPKLGRALLWPSVLDADSEAQDPRTHHQAKPVKKGLKFAANSWIHLYNYEKANLWGCTGAFD